MTHLTRHDLIKRPGLAVGLSALLVGASIGASPPALVPYLATLLVVASVVICSLAYGTVLLYFVILASATAGLLHGLETHYFDELRPTIQTLLWMLVALTAFVLSVLRLERLKIPRHYYPLLLFLAWAALRFMTGSASRTGLRHLLLYCIPICVGVYTAQAISTCHRGNSDRIAKLILFASLIPMALYVLLTPFGLVELTPGGPLGLVQPRPTAIFLSMALPVSLATWRYGENPQVRGLGALVSVLVCATILFTMSRTASLAALIMLILFKTNPGSARKLATVVAVAGAVSLVALYSIPQLRQRSFREVPGAGVTQQYVEFNLSRRGELWPAVFVHALEHPIIGWGPGTARVIAGRIRNRPDGDYPHNEYLHLFHDFGVIGLILFFGAWLLFFASHLRHWRLAHTLGKPSAARWGMIGTLALLPIMITALTDNTFHYPFILAPVFVLMECAYQWGHIDRTSEPTVRVPEPSLPG